MRSPRRSLVPLLALSTALALAGCGSAATPAASTSSPAPTRSATAGPMPTVTEAAPVEPTCDTMLSQPALDAYAARGWTGEPDVSPQWIGTDVFADGLICVWTDDHSQGTDDFDWYAWASIDAPATESAVAALTADGSYRVEEAEDGTYVTDADPTAEGTHGIVDSDGYGRTFLFRDGAVTGSETRAQTRAIVVSDGASR